MYVVDSAMGPNVRGNRRADEMRAEDQVVNRRVRLTARLGLEPGPRSADATWHDAANGRIGRQRSGESRMLDEGDGVPKGRNERSDLHRRDVETDVAPPLW